MLVFRWLVMHFSSFVAALPLSRWHFKGTYVQEPEISIHESGHS